MPARALRLTLLGLSLPFLLAARPPAPPTLSRIEKLARLAQLEDRRSTGEGELERYLRSPDRGLRRRAALAAGRVGDPAFVPTLIELMNDSEPEVRQMTAFALGLIGDTRAVERLIPALKDGDSTVRARSAEALGRMGDVRGSGPIAEMVQAALPPSAPHVTVRGDNPASVDDPWFEARLGLFALARFKDTRAAESVLLSSGRSRFDWWVATWVAMRLESPALRPVLLEGAASSEALSRVYAARGLGALKRGDAVETLLKLVKDPDEIVVVNALRALALVGDPRGTPAAGALLGSKSAALREEALKALAGLPPDASLRARVVAFAGDRDPALRAAGLRALAHMDRDDFALVLSGLDPDPEWSVRAALAQALGDLGGELAQGVLLAMLKDEDARVVPAVLEGVRKARGADALSTLRQQLEHSDFAVRAAAAEGLTALKSEGDSERLWAAYGRGLKDQELDARAAIVGALAVQKDAAARQHLGEIASSDPARPVRVRAREALQAAGQSAPDVGPQPASRPEVDYRGAMRPFDPAPGQQLYSPRAILHTRRGRIELQLDIVETPLTTQAFMDLARRGFYDGLSFHRVVPGFVVQGGDPRGDGNGGPGYTLRCELGERPYGRGAVGMALSGRDTGGSQFFITTAPTPHLDGAYTLFGQVTAGQDVVESLRPGDLIEHVEIWDGR